MHANTKSDTQELILHYLCNGETKFRLQSQTLRNLIDPKEGTTKEELEETLAKAIKSYNSLSPNSKLKFEFLNLIPATNLIKGQPILKLKTE